MLRGANENDQGTESTVEAAVSLHMASRLASGPPFTALGSRISGHLPSDDVLEFVQKGAPYGGNWLQRSAKPMR
jgi:hypothetical protein